VGRFSFRVFRVFRVFRGPVFFGVFCVFRGPVLFRVLRVFRGYLFSCSVFSVVKLRTGITTEYTENTEQEEDNHETHESHEKETLTKNKKRRALSPPFKFPNSEISNFDSRDRSVPG
jgi:hypothetical protein